MERDHLEDLDVDERMIFKYFWKKWIVGRGLDLCGSGRKWRVLKTPLDLGFCIMRGIS